jgi:hypothetical protein
MAAPAVLVMEPLPTKSISQILAQSTATRLTAARKQVNAQQRAELRAWFLSLKKKNSDLDGSSDGELCKILSM